MAPLQSWVDIDPQSHFSIYNIPFGIITTTDNKKPHPAVAIGDYALDLLAFTEGNGFSALSTIQPYQKVFYEPTLNAFAALTREYHTIVREYLQSVLLNGGPFPEILQRNYELRKKALIQLDQCENHMPMKIGDYTDFYAGLNHAETVGTLFRGAENALQLESHHVQPPINMMAVQARQRHDSPAQHTTERGSYANMFRQGLDRLSRLIERRPAHTLAYHPLSTNLSDYDEYSISQLSHEKSAAAQYKDDVSQVHPLRKLALPSSVSLGAANLPFNGSEQADPALILPLSQLRKTEDSITKIDIRFEDGEHIFWRRPKRITELPKHIRKQIWRNAIVQDEKLFLCARYRAEGVVATQPPLTCTSYGIRAETLPIFYGENRFKHPVQHPGKNRADDWIYGLCRQDGSLLRHLELSFLNPEGLRTTGILRELYGIVPAGECIAVESVKWGGGEGKSGEVEWYIFTGELGAVKAVEAKLKELYVEEMKAKEVKVEEVSDDEDDTKSVGTSILDDKDEDHYSDNALSFEPDDSSEAWETASSSGESSDRLIMPTAPPQVHLTRKNGEAFGNPRWSFAGKFNDHVVKRLASLSKDTQQTVARKPVPVTVVPQTVVASDRHVEEKGFEESVINTEEAEDAPLLLHSKRYSSGSWVMR